MFDPKQLSEPDLIRMIDEARSLSPTQQIGLVERTNVLLSGRQEAQMVLKRIKCAVLADCYNEALLCFSGMDKCYSNLSKIIKNAYLLALNKYYQSN